MIEHDTTTVGTARPFVGRQAELSFLADAWRTSLAGGARVVGVEGGSGIGKTALVQRFRAEVAPRVCAWASGDEQEAHLPWGVLWQLARQLHPDLAAMVEELDAQADPLFVGKGLLRHLESLDQLLLVVDDAQWADKPSLAALRFVARRLVSGPVTYPVLTLVVHQPAGAAGALAQPWPSPGLDDGWRRIFESDRGSRVKLDGLSPAELVELASEGGHPGLNPTGAARLREHTAGNPLYAQAVLDQVPLRLIAGGGGALPAPHDLALIVADQLGRCSSTTQQLVTAGSVLGRRFRLATVRTLARLTDTAQPVAEAVAARFLAEVPGTQGQDLEFTHGLVQAAIYDDLGAAYRRELHRRAAGLLGGTAALRHRIAAADGPDRELAADLEAIAREELRRGRIPVAAAQLRTCLDLTAPGPDRRPRLLSAVEALLIAGDAITAAEYADEVLAGEGDPWADYVAGQQAMVAGRIPDARQRLGRALATMNADGPAPKPAPGDLTARVASLLATIGIVTLSYPDMVEYGEVAVRAGTHEPWVAAYAWFARSVGLALAGRGAEALAGLAGVDMPGAPGGLDGLVARGMIRLWRDDLPRAHKDLLTVVERATNGEALRIAQALGFLGEVEYRRGMLAESVLHTELAIADAEENGRVWDFAMLHALASYPRAARGEWAEADAHAATAAEWAPLLGIRSSAAFAAGSRATVAAARGDAEAMLAAGEDLDAAYDSLEPGTYLLGPVRADALSRLGRLDEAETALDVFSETLAASGRRSALLGVARVRAQIHLARGDARAARTDCAVAAELAGELGLPLEAARIELLTGRCLLAQGRRGGAERHIRGAVRQFTVLGAHAYTKRALAVVSEFGLSVDTAHGPFDTLTDTERAVTRLACDRLSNKEIAARLIISQKTVEYHLAHVFDKLDVSSRQELRHLVEESA
ncbi:MAG TPA: AAA family ATPase [Pseudonocardiaceae bacterium]|jgi:DNA-binding CsgD family transcriptional regulator|nr:AAA family ATPase [Pseudonocardiaceae bacterium]